MLKLKESKKLNRKILVNEDKETYKIIRVKDKENLKTLYDDKSLVIEAVDIADENINRILDALKNEKIIAKDVVVNIFVIKGTFLNSLFDIENRLKYAPNTNIISIMLSDLENISKLMQSQLRYTLGVKWMDNLLDNLANGKSVEEILGEESIDEENEENIEESLDTNLLETMNFDELNNILQKMINRNATDEELNEFIETIADNEVISNDEYSKLLNKAQDTRKIESKEELYACYEEPFNGEKKTKEQWKEVYNNEIDKNEWPDFEGWWDDMINRSELLIKEEISKKDIDEVQDDIENGENKNTTNNVDIHNNDEFKDTEKYVIYTNNETYPVIKKDGKYLIARQHSKDFSEDWELVGILPIGAALSRIIKPEDAIANITDWKFKNGNPKYTIVDKDHGTKRIWGGASNGVRRGINSFAKADDHTFEMITENKNKTELDTMLEKLNSKGIKLRDLI